MKGVLVGKNLSDGYAKLGTNTDGITPLINPRDDSIITPQTSSTAVSYDAADTGLEAGTVQEAIDQLVVNGGGNGGVSRTTEVTLAASAWTGNTAPYTQTITISTLVGYENGTIGLSQSATQAQREAAAAALIGIIGQTSDTLTVVADGVKPTIDIPAAVVFYGNQAEATGIPAEYIVYDGSNSGLEATTIQGAIDELSDKTYQELTSADIAAICI